jgi:ribosomal-protein-alanine N-acetyltransferase
MIHLRDVRESDLNDEYLGWMNDPEVNKFLETRFRPQTMDDLKYYFHNHREKQDEPWWAICYGNDHIGNIKLGLINWIHRHGDISLFIGNKSYWGKGFGTGVIRLVTSYAFNCLNLHKVKAGIYVDNHASYHAFHKAGFKESGYLIDDRFIDGKYMDLLIMERLNG